MLSNLLEQVSVNNGIEDKRIWMPDKSAGLSCKSAFLKLSNEGGMEDRILYKYAWNAIIPSTVKFVAWTIGLGRINTNEMIQRRRPFHCISPNWCVM